MKKFNNIFKIEFYKIAMAVLLIGMGAGVASFLLHEGILFISNFMATAEKFTLKTLIFSSLLAMTSYLLTKYLFKDTNGSGIPQVKLNLAVLKGRMPRRMPLGKFITTLLTLASGLSFGKEGPLVTISASWGYLVSHLFGLNRKITKVLVSSGATAGLAAAFNTPIAAVVFTIEEILGELNTKYLGPIIVTSVIASVTSYGLLGNKSTFLPLNYKLTNEWHVFLYILLGLTMSLMGIFWTKMVIYFKSIKELYFKKIDYTFVLFPVILTALASLYSTETLGDGISTINRLLAGKGDLAMSSIGIILLLKIVLSATAYSSGLSGGLFMPVLFLGAAGGALFGVGLETLGFADIEIGVFALLGMTSLLVAVIRVPFTAFVMLFEMTRDYELILPLMASSISAYWISMLFNSESIYEEVAKYEGVHLPSHRDNEYLNEMTIEEAMVKDVLTLESEDTLDQIIEVVKSNNFGSFPIMSNNKLVGLINRYDVEVKYKEDPTQKLGTVAQDSIISVYPDQSLIIALDRMKRFEIGRLFVVSRFNDKHLLGIITPEDVVNYLGLSKTEL